MHESDVIQLCSTIGPIEFADNNHTVLVFLEGKDGKNWLPNREGEGVIPQGKDGRFKEEWTDGSKTSATVDELKGLIR